MLSREIVLYRKALKWTDPGKCPGGRRRGAREEGNTMKRWFHKGLALLLTLAAAVMTLPSTVPVQAYGPGDIVEFGSYPQSRVTDAGLMTALNACTLGADNTVTYEGHRYQRVYFTSPINTAQAENGYVHHTVYWFRFDPIRWKVLSGSDTDLLLLTESILDNRVYNTPSAAVTWATCTLRAWLGDGFFNKAFSPGEQAKILNSALANADNPAFGTEGGADTTDKVFLLSYADSVNTAYGFNALDAAGDAARQGAGSDYAKSQGLKVYSGYSIWWLRSPGQSATYAQACNHLGWSCNSYETTNQNTIGVRPSIRVNLTVAAYETGDIIEFGSYPQSQVTDASLLNALNALTPDADGNVEYGGNKYRRVFFEQYTPYYTNYTPNAGNSFQDDNGYYINTVYWFLYEPVEWRVLAFTNGELMLMAERLLVNVPYNTTNTNVTWESCTLRAWLNNHFMNAAFNVDQKAKIKNKTHANPDNPWWGTEGGADTSDKLRLLSQAEAVNASYGFSADYVFSDTARMAQGTDFAKSQGLWVGENGKSHWWLGIPGEAQYTAGCATNTGALYDGEFNFGVHSTRLGVRPVIYINSSSELLTPVAGSGCVVDYLGSRIYGLAPGLSAIAGYATAAAGYTLAYAAPGGALGTGALVKVKLDDATVERYAVLLFGDVNGDGNIDTSDAGIIIDYENFLIFWDQPDDALYLKAADLNGDGNIDTADAGIIVDFENFLLTINQTTGLAG